MSTLTKTSKTEYAPSDELGAPRFEEGKALLIAGLKERYGMGKNEGIPLQWQRFASYIGNIDGQIGRQAYGVCCNSDETEKFDYISGVEVSSLTNLPGELRGVSISEQRYAVFSHRGPVSAISSTICAIWSKWLPESGHQVADSSFFEKYPENFNPDKDLTGAEIWLPVRP
jgi:AraC family transcriptional regulator